MSYLDQKSNIIKQPILSKIVKQRKVFFQNIEIKTKQPN